MNTCQDRSTSHPAGVRFDGRETSSLLLVCSCPDGLHSDMTPSASARFRRSGERLLLARGSVRRLPAAACWADTLSCARIVNVRAWTFTTPPRSSSRHLGVTFAGSCRLGLKRGRRERVSPKLKDRSPIRCRCCQRLHGAGAEQCRRRHLPRDR